MKNYISSLIFLFISFLNFGQNTDKGKIEKIEEFQKHLNEEYRDPEESPLSEDDRLAFTGPVYVKYADLYFTLKGEKQKLAVYQSQSLKTDPEYYDYLFLPFTDLTNGDSTYGGGRYIDLRIPEDGVKKITLDFNQAYNPYCAYSGGYSCPVPPAENNLDAAITAGVKTYSKVLTCVLSLYSEYRAIFSIQLF